MIILSAILGLIVGSFLNAFYFRRLSGKKISVGGRSLCPKCKHKLGAKDLVPVFSYIFLQGKCRYCKTEISVQYPLVELFTSMLFALVFYAIFKNQSLAGITTGELTYLSLKSLFWFYVVSVLVLITISDLKTMIIPDEVIYPAIIIAFFYAVTMPFFGSSATYALSMVGKNLLGALAAGMFFYSMILVSGGKWMGGGDVKLAFFAGLILGWINVIVALFSAFISGSIYGLAMVAMGKRKMAEAIPFGPFIVLGILAAFSFGPEIISWYLGIIIL